ncbi:hypothetical protein DFS33DRAFT_1415449 [Desarmillaria ectypa]|nr:hypothetical protein DFS33DRAFT_1415449 [Desarmillaria ectypa]
MAELQYFGLGHNVMYARSMQEFRQPPRRPIDPGLDERYCLETVRSLFVSTNAWFFTLEERSSAVQRIKFIRYCRPLPVIENQTGVKNQHFKKEQYKKPFFYPCPASTQALNPRMIEALTDIKAWLFTLFSVLANIPNSLANQRQIIILLFGFSNLNTTLLGCVAGVVAVLAVWSGTAMAARIPNSQAWVGVAHLIPNLAAVFLMLFLSWDEKAGLLVTLFFAGLGVTAFGMPEFSAYHRFNTVAMFSLSWLSSTTAGHTKKITSIRSCYPLIVSVMRDAEPVNTVYDNVYIEWLKDDGVMEKARVDKDFLDLTDKQNRDFRYFL